MIKNIASYLIRCKDTFFADIFAGLFADVYHQQAAGIPNSSDGLIPKMRHKMRAMAKVGSARPLT